MSKIKIVCAKCGQEFEDYPSNYRKYCSRECAGHTMFCKGQKAHNKGIFGIVKQTEETKRKVGEASKRLWQREGYRERVAPKISKTLMGHLVSEETKKRIRANAVPRFGEANNKWKGDKAGYTAIHDWIRNRLGNPKVCTECGSTQQVQWANISHQYRRDVNDYKSLCYKCHRKFDKGTWGSIKRRFNSV
jgi:hypothetical protein